MIWLFLGVVLAQEARLDETVDCSLDLVTEDLLRPVDELVAACPDGSEVVRLHVETTCGADCEVAERQGPPRYVIKADGVIYDVLERAGVFWPPPKFEDVVIKKGFLGLPGAEHVWFVEPAPVRTP